MLFVVVTSKGAITLFLVSDQRLQSHLLPQVVHLCGNIKRCPVHLLLELLHRRRRQLQFTTARFALLKVLDVLFFQDESLEVREHRGSAKALNTQIPGRAAKAVHILSGFQVILDRAVWSKFTGR